MQQIPGTTSYTLHSPNVGRPLVANVYTKFHDMYQLVQSHWKWKKYRQTDKTHGCDSTTHPSDLKSKIIKLITSL